MEAYLKIKAFAELTGLSVRTLQYYDEIDLLKPAHIDENGHRFYDAESFSKVFVIQSLKRMGMRLSEIHQTINHETLDMRVFLEAEQRRVEMAIADLQLQLIRLSRLSEQIKEQSPMTPAMFPLFSQIVQHDSTPRVQMEDLLKQVNMKTDFNLKDWKDFIENLNACFQKQLPVTDERALACVRFWKTQVLKAHHVQDEMVRFAEIFYQQNQGDAYGMTADSYNYLVQLMRTYDA